MVAADSPVGRDFLAGAGEMGSRIREFDWSRTPLGPISTWPQSLKTAVGLILRSQHPMWIGWGSEMTFLYNDAYLHVLGPAKHPSALGNPASKVWAEIWDVCGPLADKVFQKGEASFVDDVRLFMDRGGFLEETFYSFSYSPITDERGEVCGLFCPSTDVTPKILNARRLGTLSELAAQSLIEKRTAAACANACGILSKNPDDVPFALLYLADASAEYLVLEQTVGEFSSELAERIAVHGRGSKSPWPVAEAFRSAERMVVSASGIPGLPRGAANQPVFQAVTLPVLSRGEYVPYGVLVLGVSPCRPLDTDYITFFELIASQVAAVIHNARTVEEEKKRADMLAEIDRAKTVFFSNVSHEFRTPLTLMLGPMENLLGNAERLTPEEYQDLVVAHRNSLRLLKLVNSLLDFSRLEAGRLKGSYSATDLPALTAELASNFRSAMESVGLKLIVDCERLPEPVFVDREMWEKIVLNLLSNALKFTFEGSVTVKVTARGEHAVLEVTDTGVGIPENELPRVFERFHRVEGTRGRTYEGTGIGLALIEEYVKLHGGEISVASSLGKGTTFTVLLPFGSQHLPPERLTETNGVQAWQPARASAFTEESKTWLRQNDSLGNGNAPEPPEPQRKTAPRILLADDNADMREHVTRILSADFDVVTASDGQEALELIAQDTPDLLLSDVMMPKLDGLGLLREIRSNPATHTLPVIFLSARAGEEMRVEGLAAGADDYLVKPFTASELRARVTTHVQMSIARRQAAEREALLRAEAEAARDRAIAVLEGITDGFIALDEQWRITYVNAEAERLNDMRREETIGKNHWELFPQSIGTTVHSEFLRCARERVAVDFENYYAPWRRWFHVKAYPAQEGGISVFFEDISARKVAEEALRDSEERFRAIVETTPECVQLIARDGTILHINSAGLQMIGAASPSEVEGLNAHEMVAPESRDTFREFHENVCSGERGALEFDRVGVNGRRRTVECHSVPLRRPDGSVIHLAVSRDITERKRAEEVQHLLAAIVDSSDDAIVSKDLNGIITSWNKGAERLFGYSAGEVRGKSITVIIPPDRLHEEPEILSRLRRGDRIDHFETVRRRKDGELLDISLVISPLRDAQGKVIGASKIARDITERKRAEKAIQELNAQLTADLGAMSRMQHLSTRLLQTGGFAELLQEIIDAGIEITHADKGNMQLVEDGALKLVAHRGFEPHFLEFFEGSRTAHLACGAALRRGERVVVEDIENSEFFSDAEALEHMRAAGVRAVESTPLISRSGQILGVFSTHYASPRRPDERELRLLDVLARQAADLIERKRAESELLASEARFRQLADAMPQIVWTARGDGTLDYCNARWYEFTGFQPGGESDQSWDKILHQEEAAACTRTWQHSVKAGTPYSMECRLWDGSENRWRWFMARALPVRGSDGDVAKWFGTFTDIDEQKRVEEELRSANKDLEQFAYSASHDLQEPLRTIKIYGELLNKRYSSRLDGQAFEFLEYLRGAASRMEMLVRDLLAYSRVAKIDPPAEPVDANEALRATLEDLKRAIEETEARITADSLPPAPVHATHLKQLLQNVIGNAIKYRKADCAPVVHVHGERKNGRYVFSVRDNGIGIDPEYRETIFGLFKRLHTGDQYSGTGLGLAICKRIVERYHGQIWVDSQPGQGSTFYFAVPA